MNSRLLLAAATAMSLTLGRALAACVPSASQVCYSGGVAVNIGPTTGNLIPWLNGLDIFSPTSGQSNLYLDHNSAAGSSIYFRTNTGTRSCLPWDSGSCTTDFQIQDNGGTTLNFLANATLMFQLSYTSPTFTFRVPVVFGSGSSFQVPTANPCTGVTPIAGLVCYDTGLHTFYYAAAPGPAWVALAPTSSLPADATTSVAGLLLASSCSAGSLVSGLGSGTGALSCGLPTVGTTQAATDRSTDLATDSFSAGILTPLANPPKTANNWGDSIYPPESAKCTLTVSGQIADYPIFIGDTTDQITQFAVDMSTGAGSGGSLEIGLRADSGSSTPGSLLVDGGAVADTAGGVDSDTAFSTLTLHRGLYWIEVETVALGSTNGVVWGVTASKPNFPTSQVLQPGTAAGVLNGSISYAMVSSTTSTTGTLSSAAPGSFSLSSSLCMPKVSWKLVSATP